MNFHLGSYEPMALRNARPATGIQKLRKPEIPRKKKLKITPPAPTTNSLKKTQDMLKNSKSSILVFFFRIF